MNELAVNLSDRSYKIYIGEDLLLSKALFTDAISGKRVMIITNDIVAPLYLDRLQETLSDFQLEDVIILDGEAFKNLKTFEMIIDKLLLSKHTRDTTIVALGGGVVGDIAGFVASCYMRGVPFIQVPTTLLAQVDSSVGGKTAVNHPLGKNMIGSFYQPKAVIIDQNCLKTLSEREFRSGMAEVIKCAILYDHDFFCWIENNIKEIKSLSAQHIGHMIKRCCEIKSIIVSLDEKETGIRALLNLGHTFAHAIEVEQGYGSWLHGEAVAAGIVLAAKTSMELNLIGCKQVLRISTLMKNFNLPLLPPTLMSYEDFAKHMNVDKKIINGKLRLVLPTSIGSCELFDDVSEKLLTHVIESC